MREVEEFHRLFAARRNQGGCREVGGFCEDHALVRHKPSQASKTGHFIGSRKPTISCLDRSGSSQQAKLTLLGTATALSLASTTEAADGLHSSPFSSARAARFKKMVNPARYAASPLGMASLLILLMGASAVPESHAAAQQQWPAAHGERVLIIKAPPTARPFPFPLPQVEHQKHKSVNLKADPTNFHNPDVQHTASCTAHTNYCFIFSSAAPTPPPSSVAFCDRNDFCSSPTAPAPDVASACRRPPHQPPTMSETPEQVPKVLTDIDKTLRAVLNELGEMAAADSIQGPGLRSYSIPYVVEHTTSNGDVLAIKRIGRRKHLTEGDIMHYAATYGVLAPCVRGVYEILVGDECLIRVIVSDRVPAYP